MTSIFFALYFFSSCSKDIVIYFNILPLKFTYVNLPYYFYFCNCTLDFSRKALSTWQRHFTYLLLKMKIIAISDFDYNGGVKDILHLLIICLHCYSIFPQPYFIFICTYIIVPLHACMLQITVLIFIYIDIRECDVSSITILKHLLVQAYINIMIKSVKILSAILLYHSIYHVYDTKQSLTVLHI